MFYRFIPPVWLKEQGAHVKEGIFNKEEVVAANMKIGNGVYWFPNHPSKDIYKEGKKYISGRDVDVFNYVFIDMDLKDGIYATKLDFLKKISEFELPPNKIIDSGNGVHAYWKINDLKRCEYTFTQMKLIRHFSTDESVWTVLQLMRVPGSVNTKDQDNWKNAEIIYEDDKNYNIDAFSFLPELSAGDLNKCTGHLDKLDGKTQIKLMDDVNLDEIPDSFIDLMLANPMAYELFNNPASYGDRSSADMKLINLLYNKDIPKKDALAVASNSQKALDKGVHRFDYAQATVDKAYVDRTKNKFKTVADLIKSGSKRVERSLVKGPSFFDCLVSGWAKKQVLGLVAGSGVGKTATTLKIFRDMIENNINDNDDLFVFFSLEMPEQEIIDRWIDLVGDKTELHSRLIVISNEDENDEPRAIGIQEVYEYCTDIKKATGKGIGAVGIDHIGIISRHIDTRKKHTFGVDNDMDSGFGDMRRISINNLCTQMKALAKMLDTFLILLTQTTKEKGIGYRPIEKDAAYGVSQYENIVDYMIGLWQPLMLVQNQADTKFLSWQYCKIRTKSKDDPMTTGEYKTLVYDLNSGDIRVPSDVEHDIFRELLPSQIEAAKAKDGNVETSYSRSIDINEINLLAEKIKEFKSE